MKLNLKRLSLALSAVGLMTITACGGGGGGTAIGTVSPTISGHAAAGLPLVGTVTVKDSLGATKTTTIGANGAYSVDVAGMTGPFVFRAEGTVAGTTYVLHSAASTADANGTINITPLTDLIVANIAGEVAANYFSSGNFSTLTKTEIDAEVASLKAKLLPMLTAMGVDSSIDLLRTQFTPLSSALDKALDVIRVSVNSTSGIATITNLVNDQQITDNLATKAAAETTTATLSGSGMETTQDDVPNIRSALTSFAALFANGLPAPATIKAALYDTTDLPFRHNDKNAEVFSNQLASATQLAGMQIADVVIHKISYPTAVTATEIPRANVSFIVKNTNGLIVGKFKNIQLGKDANGTWKLRGDRRRLDIDGHPHVTKDAVSGCTSTGIEFDIKELVVGGGSGDVSYLMVTGPGLPSGGLKYSRAALNGDYWGIANVTGQEGNRWYKMASSCFDGAGAAGVSDANMALIPENAVYSFTGYNVSDMVVQSGEPLTNFAFTERILRRPLTLTETKTAAFPIITAPTNTSLSTYTGGDLVISASAMNPKALGWVYLGLSDGSSTVEQDSNVVATSTGFINKTMTLSNLPNAGIRDIRVETQDETYQRGLMTYMYLNSFTTTGIR